MGLSCQASAWHAAGGSPPRPRRSAALRMDKRSLKIRRARAVGQLGKLRRIAKSALPRCHRSRAAVANRRAGCHPAPPASPRRIIVGCASFFFWRRLPRSPPTSSGPSTADPTTSATPRFRKSRPPTSRTSSSPGATTRTTPSKIPRCRAIPIVVDGVLYATTPKLRVVALDAATGRELWSFNPRRQGAAAQRRFRHRGVTVYKDRVFFTYRNFLYALDRMTGKPIQSFGDNGRIDLRKGLDRPPETRHHQRLQPRRDLRRHDHHAAARFRKRCPARPATSAPST